MTPLRQLGFDPVFQSAQAQLVEANRLRLGEWLVGELRQRCTSPQPQRLAQPLHRPDVIAFAKGYTPFGDEPLETARVELVRIDTQQITRWPSHQRAFRAAGRPARLHHCAQARHVVPQRRSRVRGSRIAPEDVGEPIR